MVKRLRRRPLTAESGVRFPMGVPKKQVLHGLVFLFSWGIALFVCATLLHEPQNTGVAFRYMSELTRYTITFTMFSTIPIGVPKKTSPLWACFLFLMGELHTLCAWLCHTNPRTLKTHNVITICKLFIFIFMKWGNLIVNCWGLV